MVAQLPDVPRKGNVDRNADGTLSAGGAVATFPARGTWIEIQRTMPRRSPPSQDVPRKGNVDRNPAYTETSISARADVPRKGNVDRNTPIRGIAPHCTRTFPARGTWIEICKLISFLVLVI